MKFFLVVILPALALAIYWITVSRRRPSAPSAQPPYEPAEPVRGLRADLAEPAVASIVAHTTGDEAARRDPVRLLEDAVVIATEVGAPSKLVLQRRLGLSFEQASDLVHRMEELGLVARVGAQKHSKLLPEAYDWAREISSRKANSGEPIAGEER